MMDTAQNLRSDIFHEMIPPEFRTEKTMTFDELAQKQCEWYNESEGRLTGIDCPDCKNRGNYQILDANGYRVMRECKCMAHRRYISMMQSAGLGDLYEQCTFDSYHVSTDWQREAKQKAIEYANKDGNGCLQSLCRRNTSSLSKISYSGSAKKQISCISMIF